ncbi:VOC family protein [Streptomyces sp. NPDC057621]|uniref:VOC family protein n=1 Tax=Streptomyces liliiviolaceus TaxID=2823109 RepID=A0A940Y0X5_9ACTN|nr:VOC family protein [Streptomyces liliiviolaceus]MBQ0852498.1 VOC family protein [Streptomyces liliiviolaceus]
MSVSLPPLLHVGIVVADLDRAAADYERRWSVAVERVMDLHFPTARFHGHEVSCSARYGFLSTGASEIELIQPLSGRSPYTEFLETNGEGVHHLAYVVGSIDQHLDALRETGEEPRVSFDAAIADQTRFVYLDGLAHGPVVELIESDLLGS